MSVQQGIHAEDMFFLLVCTIHKYGKDNTLMLDNAKDMEAWIKNLGDTKCRLAVTAMPDGETLGLTILVGDDALKEYTTLSGEVPQQCN